MNFKAYIFQGIWSNLSSIGDEMGSSGRRGQEPWDGLYGPDGLKRPAGLDGPAALVFDFFRLPHMLS